MKISKILLYSLGAFPLTFVVSLMSFYLHAKHELGYAPTPGEPDPKELSIYIDYYPFIHWTGTIWLFSFLVWVTIIMVYLAKYGRKTATFASVIFSCIGQFCGIGLLLTDIIIWYWD